MTAHAESTLRAAVLAELDRAERRGDTALRLDALRERLAPGGSAANLLADALNALQRDGAASVDPRRGIVQRADLATEESRIRSRLDALRSVAKRRRVEPFAAVVLDNAEPPLTAEQRAATEAWLTEGVAVLTGGPGTGKTTTLRAILAALPRSSRVALLAPTARAARVLEAVTGREAHTVSRALEQRPDPGGKSSFGRDTAHPLAADVVVCDEASMLGHRLGAALLDAIPDGARVLFVGDHDQLPPVEPGDLLGALLAGAGDWPAHRLTELHRNAGLGAAACAAVRRCEVPTFAEADATPDPTGANVWAYTVPADEQPGRIVELLHWAAAAGFDPRHEVAVVTANSADAGPISAPRLNVALQAALNPQSADTGNPDPKAQTTWRLGDVLVCRANHKPTGAVNGERLTLREADTRTGWFVLERADGTAVATGNAQELELELGYTTTVYALQGGSAPLVILALDAAQQAPVVGRRWLHTALSRFERFAFVLEARPGDTARVAATVRPRVTGLARYSTDPPS